MKKQKVWFILGVAHGNCGPWSWDTGVLKYQQPQIYPKGLLSVLLEFEAAGDVSGIEYFYLTCSMYGQKGGVNWKDAGN